MTMMQSAHLEQSIDFAQIINKNLKSGPITVNRGVSQDPFYVLWKTTMPAVLVELGFISNPDNLAQLKKPAQRQELARRLLLAFSEYKQQYDRKLVSKHGIRGDAGSLATGGQVRSPGLRRVVESREGRCSFLRLRAGSFSVGKD